MKFRRIICRISIVLFIFAIGFLVGAPVGDIKNIEYEYTDHLIRGTYSNHPQSDYVLTIEADKTEIDTFVLYYESKLYDSGNVILVDYNSFLLRGEKSDYYAYPIYSTIDKSLVLYEDSLDFIFFKDYAVAVIGYE